MTNKPHTDTASPPPPPAAAAAGRLTRLAWLPVPLLLAAMLILWAAGLRTEYESPGLQMLLNLLTRTLASLLIVCLAGRSFLASGSLEFLLVGCGAAIWGGAGFVTNSLASGDPNAGVTISNLGTWLAALCFLAGAVLSHRPVRAAVRAAGLWLGAGYALAAALVAFVSRAALEDRLPVFFVQGLGGTPVRHFVLGSAIALLALASFLLRAGDTPPPTGADRAAVHPFWLWFRLSLLLIAASLVGLLIEVSRNTLLDWTCRAALYLGGVYMTIGAMAPEGGSRGEALPLETGVVPRRTWATWLPLLLATALAAALWHTRHQPAWGPAGWLPQFNAVLATLVSLVVATLAARSVMAGGRRSLALLGSGMLAYGAASALGGICAATGRLPQGVAIFNLGVCLAGAATVAGAVFLLMPAGAVGAGMRWQALRLCYAGVLLAIGAVAWLAHAGAIPPFFEGQTPTPLRHAVLGATIVEFACASLVLFAASRRGGSAFLRLYGLGTAAIAMGHACVYAIRIMGSPLGWAGTASMCVGLAYLLAAGLRAAPRVGGGAPAAPGSLLPGDARHRYGMAVTIVLAAAALLLVLSPVADTHAALVTFYPAVILASLYGRLRAGLLATALAAGVISFFWLEPVGSFAIAEAGDRLALAVFAIGCALIGVVVEALHRSHARVAAAEAQAGVAAERERATEALRALNADLERRVAERTSELRRSNESLEQRVTERTGEIQKANAALEASRRAALNVMDDAVAARTQAELAAAELARRAEELRVSNEEMARFNRVAVDRELRMIELKKQVNELCAKLGEPPEYRIEDEQK